MVGVNLFLEKGDEVKAEKMSRSCHLRVVCSDRDVALLPIDWEVTVNCCGAT